MNFTSAAHLGGAVVGFLFVALQMALQTLRFLEA
jgi:hypothetical protein